MLPGSVVKRMCTLKSVPKPCAPRICVSVCALSIVYDLVSENLSNEKGNLGSVLHRQIVI